MIIDILSLCVGGFVGCWSYVATVLIKYTIELANWSEARSLACDNTCMCGSPMESHGWGDNHGAMSQLDWHDSHFSKPLFK